MFDAMFDWRLVSDDVRGMAARILIALPSADFDPTEVAVPWNTARHAGVEVVFATEDGGRATCDELVLHGPLFGLLGAKKVNCQLYERLSSDAAFAAPYRFADVDVKSFDGLLLPGGHAKGMRSYLESDQLQAVVLEFMRRDLPIAAICHGPVVLARTIDPQTGRPIVAGRHMTALTRPLENVAWLLTAWFLGDYYRTYPTWVEAELRQAIGADGVFERGPLFARYSSGFVVKDRNLLTARWPGDASRFADEFVAMLTP